MKIATTYDENVTSMSGQYQLKMAITPTDAKTSFATFQAFYLSTK